MTNMSPKRAIQYIQFFELPTEEESVIIECDVRGKSCIQAADLLHTSPDTVKRYRRKAYRKIVDEINRI